MKDLEMGDYSALSGWALDVITRVLIRGRQERGGRDKKMRCDIMNKGPSNTKAGFENEGNYEARIWVTSRI